MGCKMNSGNNKNNEANTDDSTKLIIENNTSDENLTPLLKAFYQIPAPDELFSILRDENLRFEISLLVPPEQIDKLVDSKSQTLFTGIYSADLAYCATLEQFQTSLDYFALVRILADKIGIYSKFDDALSNRIKNNISNLDSLQEITEEIHLHIVNDLVEVGNTKTLICISFGGWLESLYLITNVVTNYNSNNLIIQRIADQKNTIDNMLVCISSFKDDAYISKMIKGLQEIKEIYATCTIEKMENTKAVKTPDGQILISGGSKIILTEKQFSALKTKITDLRNSILSNN